MSGFLCLPHSIKLAPWSLVRRSRCATHFASGHLPSLETERFISAYASAQAIPGPMFTIATYLGAEQISPNHSATRIRRAIAAT